MLTRESKSLICFAVFFFGAFWTRTTGQDLQLQDLDLKNWDCLTKPEGSAKTQDGKERNRQKNRSPLELAGFNVVSLDTAAFLQRVADYDRKFSSSTGARCRQTRSSNWRRSRKKSFH